PVETAAGVDERPGGGRLRDRTGDADPGRYLPLLPVDEDGQVGVDVEDRLLGRLAGDAVDGLASGGRRGSGQRGPGRDRDPFGAHRAGRGGGLERAERGQRRVVTGGRGGGH